MRILIIVLLFIVSIQGYSQIKINDTLTTLVRIPTILIGADKYLYIPDDYFTEGRASLLTNRDGGSTLVITGAKIKIGNIIKQLGGDTIDMDTGQQIGWSIKANKIQVYYNHHSNQIKKYTWEYRDKRLNLVEEIYLPQ